MKKLIMTLLLCAGMLSTACALPIVTQKKVENFNARVSDILDRNGMTPTEKEDFLLDLDVWLEIEDVYIDAWQKFHNESIAEMEALGFIDNLTVKAR